MAETKVKVEGTGFDFEDLNAGTWFTYPDGKSEYCLRTMPVGVYDELRRKHVRKKVEFKNGQRYETEEPNNTAFNEDMWDYCIRDWRGVYNTRTGEVVPCTREFKIALMKGNVAFAAFVSARIKELSEIETERAENQLKN